MPKISFYILVATILLLHIQCATKKEADSSNSSEQTNTTTTQKKQKENTNTPSPKSPQEKATTDTSGIQVDSSQVKSIHLPSDDSLFCSLRRTPCFGACPIYYVRIYKGGFVLLYGKKFTKKKGYPSPGWFTSQIPQAKIDAIKEKATEIGYFKLKNRYDKQVTDVPSTTTYLSFDGQSKEVYHRFDGPERLSTFENFIDQQLQNVSWKTVQMKKEH